MRRPRCQKALVAFIYSGLEQMPIAYGKRAELMKQLEVMFVESASSYGCNLVDFPEIMPEKLVDSKFLNEDWRITAPTGERFVLAPEITALYSDLLGQYPKTEELQKIAYVSTCFRENRFKQLGLEMIDNSEEADVSVVSAAYRYLSDLGLGKDVEVAISDLNNLRDTIDLVGIKPEYRNRALKAIDNSNSLLRKGKDFEEYFDAEMGSCEAGKTASDALRRLIVSGESIVEPSEEFMRVYDVLEKQTGARLDAALARGLSYYNSLPPRKSALIFEIYSKNDLAQICGGGRYDGMPGRFNPALSGTELDRGIGFAFGLERVLEVVLDKYGDSALEVLR